MEETVKVDQTYLGIIVNEIELPIHVNDYITIIPSESIDIEEEF